MKKQWILRTLAIGLPLVALVIVLGMIAGTPAQAAPPARPLHAPAATLVVTSTADSGYGTLRWALQTAVVSNTITFDTGVFPPSSPVTITLASQLPSLNQGNLTIDGSNAGVVIDGCNTPTATYTVGFWISSDNNVIKGLQILNFPASSIRIQNAGYNVIGGNNTVGTGPTGEGNVLSGNGNKGVYIDGSGAVSNTVVGNYIGVDAVGSHVVPTESQGVGVLEGADYTTIGGTTQGLGNIIGGSNHSGILLWSDHNRVVGNLIGLDATGTFTLPNSVSGIHISNAAAYNVIEDNVISGNDGPAVYISDSGTVNNTVIGNYIGTDVSGTASLPNTGDGVHIINGASYNLVGGINATPGGVCSGACNLISGNDGSGVLIEGSGTMSNTVSGNYIGTNISGTVAIGNTDNGISIEGGAIYNVIGGDTPGERNIISDNGSGGSDGGVTIEGDGTTYNVVSGNYIGTDATGTAAIPNWQHGVAVKYGASSNAVGGTSPGERNVIVNWVGVTINDGGSNNEIVGNYIGVDASDTFTMSTMYTGVRVDFGGDYTHIVSNTIRGARCHGIRIGWASNPVGTQILSNTISDNGWLHQCDRPFAGISLDTPVNTLVAYNRIYDNWDPGIAIQGSDALSNTFTQNSIYNNTGLGIDLLDGANGNIVAPVVTAFDAGAGTASGTACANCTVEVFSDNDDEGQWYEGTTTANGMGDWSFSKGSAFTGPNVHATATDAAGNTSEFSGPPPVVSSVSPAIAAPDTVGLLVTIQGDYFREDEPLTVDFGAGVTVTNTQFISRTQLQVTLDVDSGAVLGLRDVTVTNFDGQSGVGVGLFEIVPAADLALTKTDSPDPVVAGEALTYTLIVVNNGPWEATGIVLTDTLPAGVTFVSATPGAPTCTESGGDVICNLGSLSSTSAMTVTIVVTPNVAGTIVNFAVVAADEYDPDPSNDADSIDTTVTTAPDPHVDSVTPDSGFNDQATPITIDGANFQPGATVFLDAIELQSVTFVNANRLQATVQAGLTPGTYDLIVTNPDETSGTLLDAFTVLEAAQSPTISRLTPAQGPDDTPVTVDILGLNFAPGLTATLSISSPQVLLEGLLFIDSTHLRGIVPINVTPGVYTLTVTNPDSSSGMLPDAYEVVDAAVSDDLYASALDLWLNPASIRQGDEITPTMGLIARRQGGQTPLIAVVNVDFYEGNPESGGSLIGRGLVAALQPDGHASTMQVPWTPSGAGTYLLYAVIDPDDAVDEDNEANNVISRTVAVLPPLPDTTPPEVDTFTINDGATNTEDRQVRLTVTAHDNPGGSGVASLLYIEYEFIQSIRDWVPVAIGDWLSYDETRTDYLWALQPSAGVHYLQVWVADGAGNISLAPGQQLINYLPSGGAHVAQGQVHIYRQPLTAGQSLRVRLTSLIGDADLYVWAPDGSSVGASYTGEPVEWVEFTAETDGVYQIEVEGWTSADYRLEITPGSGMQMTGSTRPLRGRADPFVAPLDTPSDEDDVVGLPSAPVSEYRIYLPVINRNYQ